MAAGQTAHQLALCQDPKFQHIIWPDSYSCCRSGITDLQLLRAQQLITSFQQLRFCLFLLDLLMGKSPITKLHSFTLLASRLPAQPIKISLTALCSVFEFELALSQNLIDWKVCTNDLTNTEKHDHSSDGTAADASESARNMALVLWQCQCPALVSLTYFRQDRAQTYTTSACIKNVWVLSWEYPSIDAVPKLMFSFRKAACSGESMLIWLWY